MDNDDRESKNFKLILDIINCLGYDVTGDELSTFLKGKEKSNLTFVSTDKKEEVKPDQDKSNEEGISTEQIKKQFFDLIKKMGYDFSDNEIKSGLESLSQEQLRIFVGNPKYRISKPGNPCFPYVYESQSNYFIERLFSEIDFFGLKKSGQYDLILRQRGKLFFRLKRENIKLQYEDMRSYKVMYDLVSYNGKEYLIRRDNGKSEIIYVPKNIFIKEFVDAYEYLKSFVYVGKRAWRESEYKGPDEQNLGEHHSKKNAMKRYVLYKNSEMTIDKIRFTGHIISSCCINQGHYFVDEGWCYEKTNQKEEAYVSLSLKDAVNEIAYGKTY